MNKRILTLCLCSLGLTACVSDDSTYQGFQSYYTGYGYQPYAYQDTRFYENSSSYGGYSQSTATVPNSYHTGPLHSPTSHKEMDRNWVNSQNPQGYTIQVGDSEKAAQVANKLYKAPKTDRSAEIKYSRDGRTYYKGVYGSYNNYEDAQKALNNLPPEIKQGADIKSWSKVQDGTE